MIIDSVALFSSATDLRSRALARFFSFMERRFDAALVRDARHFPFQRPDLIEEFRIAATLQRGGIISAVYSSSPFPDEPSFKHWSARCNDRAEHRSGGATADSDRDALRAALAEALERYLWTEETDYFNAPKRASLAEMTRSHTPFLAPRRFAGFSDDQRTGARGLRITDNSPFLWTRGTSLVSGKKTYIPAQTISGVQGLRMHEGVQEPLIRASVTTGLATWPEQSRARLGGILEVIERDAYMISWLNQFVLPRVALAPLYTEHAHLRTLVERCTRYGLKVHAVRLLTDAPAHAICVVLEDESAIAPRFAFGLKAHHSLPKAIEGALTEALRARTNARRGAPREFDRVEDIGHTDRMFYWMDPQRSEGLRFFVSGREEIVAEQPFEHDTPTEHLQRILLWCKEKGYECVSVSLGTSRKNPLPWYIENVVIPELQPMHLFENFPHIGGERLAEIPKQFGYTPLPKPHTATPHPFV